MDGMVGFGVSRSTVDAGLLFALGMNAARLIAVAVALGLLLAEAFWLRNPKEPNVPVAKPVGTGLALEVQREGRALRVSWDRESSVIRLANHATLRIVDGSHNTQLELNAAETKVGKLVYWPDTERVTVRLEVNSPMGMAAQTIHAADAPPPPIVVQSDSPTEGKPSPFDQPRRRRLQQVSVPAAPVLTSQSNIPAPKSTGFFGKLAHKIPVVRRFQKAGHRPTASAD